MQSLSLFTLVCGSRFSHVWWTDLADMRSPCALTCVDRNHGRPTRHKHNVQWPTTVVWVYITNPIPRDTIHPTKRPYSMRISVWTGSCWLNSVISVCKPNKAVLKTVYTRATVPNLRRSTYTVYLPGAYSPYVGRSHGRSSSSSSCARAWLGARARRRCRAWLPRPIRSSASGLDSPTWRGREACRWEQPREPPPLRELSPGTWARLRRAHSAPAPIVRQQETCSERERR